MNEFNEYIVSNQLGDIYQDVDMREHSTMKVGGICKVMYIPETIDQLQKVVKFLHKKKIKHKFIGRGSNCIFMDDMNSTIIIKISNVLDCLEINDDFVYVGAGYSMMKFAKVMSKQGFSGLEFAGGIPGTIGGAIYMNAGAHLSEISNILLSVDVIDEVGNYKTLNTIECEFGYRDSIFHKKDWIICGAKFEIVPGDKASVFKKMSGNLEYRKEMQPLEFPSCGSSFRNPPNNHAGKLIEECGLKNHKIGGAKISDKHANFIVNEDGATAQDIYELVKHVQKVVFEKTNIKLHPEMEFVMED